MHLLSCSTILAQNWEKQNYDDGYITQARLVRFLHEELVCKPRLDIGRPKKASTSYLAPEASADDVASNFKNSLRTLKVYSSAINGYAINKYQMAHDKTGLVENLRTGPRDPIGQLFRGQQVTYRRSSTKVDKALNTVVDYINDDMFGKILLDLWNTNDGLKSRADVLLSYAFVARSELNRELVISDLSLHSLGKEGPKDCKVLIATFNASKSNQFGNIETASAYRHRFPHMCPIGSLAFYFFHRFQVENDIWPDFSKRESWYHVPVLRDLSYGQGDQGYSKKNGVITQSVTHMCRKKSSQDLVAADVDGVQIKKAGRWSDGALVGAYLNQTIPRQACRVLAGFSKDDNGYFLERAEAIPPAPLLEMVYPFVQKSLKEEEIDKTLTGKRFLELMVYLRTVFIQDAAALFLMPEYNDHALFEHALFKTKEFRDFLASVKPASEPITETANPAANPAMFRYLNSQFEAAKSSQEKIMEKMLTKDDAVRLFSQAAATLGAPKPLQAGGPPENVDIAPERMSFDYLNYCWAKVNSLTDVWREWNMGVNGLLPVKLIESKYGTRWRPPGLGKAKRLSRLMSFFTYVEDRSREGERPDDVVAILEAERQVANKSILAFCEGLRDRLEVV